MTGMMLSASLTPGPVPLSGNDYGHGVKTVVLTPFSKPKNDILFYKSVDTEIVEGGIVEGNLRCMITNLKATLRVNQKKKSKHLPLPVTPPLISCPLLVSWAHCIWRR